MPWSCLPAHRLAVVPKASEKQNHCRCCKNTVCCGAMHCDYGLFKTRDILVVHPESAVSCIFFQRNPWRRTSVHHAAIVHRQLSLNTISDWETTKIAFGDWMICCEHGACRHRFGKLCSRSVARSAASKDIQLRRVQAFSSPWSQMKVPPQKVPLVKRFPVRRLHGAPGMCPRYNAYDVR